MTTTALITGASAGIGRHLAETFADKGHDLILVARSKGPMETLASELSERHGIHVDVHSLDLSGPNAADHLFNALADREIDILVNNAGVLSGGSFANMDADAIDNMMTLNIRALTQLCHRFAAPMVERGTGRILNIASVAAFQPVPKLAVYAATKAYVLSLSEALSVELARKGVSVTAVCPGYTDTEMLRGPIAKSGGQIRIPEFTVLDPKRVAKDAYDACMAGDAVKVPGIGYAVSMATTRMLPKWLVRRITALTMN